VPEGLSTGSHNIQLDKTTCPRYDFFGIFELRAEKLPKILIFMVKISRILLFSTTTSIIIDKDVIIELYISC